MTAVFTYASVACACVSAGVCGTCVTRILLESHHRRRARRRLREAAGISDTGSSVALATEGLARTVLSFALDVQRQLTYQAPLSFASALHMQRFQEAWFSEHVRAAGLERSLEAKGFNEARIRLALGGMLGGAGIGMVFSNELSLLLALALGVAGMLSVGWALRQETTARAAALESELPEMLEVVSLGLRSGLTFDRGFRLYHTHFSTAFSQECARVQQSWELGLSSREDALRGLAGSYDSALFSRVIESVVRSLRFGSSLAETLEASAAEARVVHKAHREERVAKAPVKMMVPTGILIMPAMLLLVLGPVLLELMEGF